jgi:putative ABC transport system permease protein
MTARNSKLTNFNREKNKLMFKNYFKVAIRSLRSKKLLSFVNIAGLSVGLACVMLILLFVNDEYSYDKFQQNGDRIARLVQVMTDTSGREFRNGNSGMPQGPAFSTALPEIEAFCRLKGWSILTKKGNEGVQSKVLYVDTTFIRIFSFEILSGNPTTMLRGRNSVVITEETAAKYFGKENPIGKSIEIEGDEKFESFVVTGIIQTPPVNSSIRFDMLVPFETQIPREASALTAVMNDWNSIYLNTFFFFKKGTDIKKAESKLWSVFQQYNGKNWASFSKNNGISKFEYKLQPFYTMHLDDQFFASNGLSDWSDATYSYILSGLAVLILLIACINFINITLARSLQRSKEIGIRKVSGSSVQQLIGQFLSEALIITFIAFLPAIVLVQLALPVFSEISGKHFDVSYLYRPSMLLLFLVLLVVVAVLAGFYPAFIASRFQPVQTLYGRFKLSGKNLLGRSLVVLQFVIAVGLIICTIVFNQQLNFVTQSDQGYKKDNLIRLEFPWGKQQELQQLKHELLQNPAIVAIGGKAGDMNKTMFMVNDKATDWTYYEEIDDSYLQLLQIPVVKGRYLSYRNTIDTSSGCMVNEAFVATYLDKSKDPIGQKVVRGGNKKEYYVTGVVKNYHLASFKEKIEPALFYLDKRGRIFNTFIKYAPGKSAAATAALTRSFKSLLPYSLLNYSFMEDWNKDMYSQEQQWKKIVSSCAFITILISCLGLFALTSLAVQQRIKEIGIRKVLGASVASITALVSKQFIILVAIALVIAGPLAWYFMNKWLQDFAYRISFGWWIFAVAGASAMLIALATVSIQAIRAAVTNPTRSLRSE